LAADWYSAAVIVFGIGIVVIFLFVGATLALIIWKEKVDEYFDPIRGPMKIGNWAIIRGTPTTTTSSSYAIVFTSEFDISPFP